MIFAKINIAEDAAFFRDREDAVFLVDRLALSSIQTGTAVYGYNITPAGLELIAGDKAESLVTEWLRAAGRRISFRYGLSRPFTGAHRRFVSLADPALMERAFLFISSSAGKEGCLNSLDHLRRFRKERFSLTSIPSVRARQSLFSSHSRAIMDFPLNSEGLVFPPYFVDYSPQKKIDKKYGAAAIAGYDRNDFLLRIETLSKTGTPTVRKFIASVVSRYPGIGIDEAILQARSRFCADALTLSEASGTDYEDVLDILLRSGSIPRD